MAAQQSAPDSTKQPTRTCVGCRRRERKADLVRLVANGDQVIVDSRAQLPGRGAYVHPSRSCIEAGLGRRAIERGLRMRPLIDTTTLAQFADQIDHQTLAKFRSSGMNAR